MPGGYNRVDEGTQNAGNYRTRIFVYQPAAGVDDTGGVIRVPGGVGTGAGASPPQTSPLWEDRAQVLQYGSQDRENAGREAGSSYATIEVRWGRNKPYIPGMIIWIPGSGDTYQIDGAEILVTSYKKHQLSCRRIV